MALTVTGFVNQPAFVRCKYGQNINLGNVDRIIDNGNAVGATLVVGTNNYTLNADFNTVMTAFTQAGITVLDFS